MLAAEASRSGCDACYGAGHMCCVVQRRGCSAYTALRAAQAAEDDGTDACGCRPALWSGFAAAAVPPPLLCSPSPPTSIRPSAPLDDPPVAAVPHAILHSHLAWKARSALAPNGPFDSHRPACIPLSGAVRLLGRKAAQLVAHHLTSIKKPDLALSRKHRWGIMAACTGGARG